jgi:hypothetical protein
LLSLSPFLPLSLSKAVSLEEKDIKGDKNPKDFILFFASDFAVSQTLKDNTGEKRYIENMVFPTLTFPSDHGITSTRLFSQDSHNNNNIANGRIRKRFS